MAEFVFKDMANKKGLENEFYIESAATGNGAVGEGIHYGTQNILKEQGIPFEERKARQMTKADYDKFDYILGMENKNIANILRIVGEDKENKVHRLLDFSSSPRDIADPWYTGDFDITYYDVEDGCSKFLEYIMEKKNEIRKTLCIYGKM